MKEWQHGLDIDYLKKIEAFYEGYNAFADSPFAKYKKNNIAQDLHEQNMIMMINGDAIEGAHVEKTSKSKSNITMYGNLVIGTKVAGDITITKLHGSEKYIESTLDTYENQNAWLYAWAEDTDFRKMILKFDYEYVGSKITTFAEIYDIYFSRKLSDTRIHPTIDETESLTLKQVGNVSLQAIESIRNKLEQMDLKYQNHYSNYNKKNSWAALSLRGYSSDILRIEKPSEMSDKWKKEHENEELHLQDTYLREQFPEVNELLNWVDGDIHRIRFMRLSPGGGELTRHTDQVDSDAGGNLGQLARLHFPIKTNDQVIFNSWGLKGKNVCANMKVGEFWYLDTRKPHTAINNGTEERIHLVVDVIVTPKLKEMLLDGGFNLYW